MACTSGFNAAEALAAISHKCRPRGESCVGISRVILMDVLYEGAVYWCRQCYSDNCKSDPDDTRARWAGPGETEDTELPLNQRKKDKGGQR